MNWQRARSAHGEWERVAAAAAGQAVHHGALARLAHAGDNHPFLLKHPLWQRRRCLPLF